MSSRSRGKVPVVLVVRDGWGVSRRGEKYAETEGNAILLAQTPVHRRIFRRYPWNLLECSGEVVGLPPGQMGNSEVGHLNLGAGRIVDQQITRITKSIADGAFFENRVLGRVMRTCAGRNARLHLIGLCSDGGVHSHLEHLFALIEMARRHRVEQLCVHCITDGRDTSPQAGKGFVERVEERLRDVGIGRIATVIGRYYAMDRDRHWDRTEQAFRAITGGQGERRPDAVEAMELWYAQDRTDEFIPPTVVVPDRSGVEECLIEPTDGVIFFNFRADRARQLTEALVFPEFQGFARQGPQVDTLVGMTPYWEDEERVAAAFPAERLDNLLAHVLAAAGRRQLRISETEKYAHVTYFFNGGIEQPVEGEERCLIPSPRVATYDLQPEMSAREITAELLSRVRPARYDFVLVNYANPDMVGHTGVLAAAIRAIEVVDECVDRLIEAVSSLGGVVLLTADHGNAETMIDEEGKPNTAHTTNPVEFAYVGPDAGDRRVRSGILADVAPTVLELLELPQPAEMTGKSLLR